LLQLSDLVERHRFIRAVCRFHSASEDEVVFPVLRRLRAGSGDGAAGRAADAHGADVAQQAQQQAQQQQTQAQQQHAQQDAQRLNVEDDHDEEGAKLEELGRLLGAVKAHARQAPAACRLPQPHPHPRPPSPPPKAAPRAER
jgi:type II secretory pathway predicted ATPase ExeA